MNAIMHAQEIAAPRLLNMSNSTPSSTELVIASEQVNIAKNIALFFAAPLIGLAYVVALPFVGVGLLISALAARRS